MPNEILWPDAAEVIRLNQLIVAGTGEPHTLLNEGALESACARPQNLWFYDEEDRIAYLAASLIIGIGQNHPFEQGNKRTALGAAIIFIQNNEYIFDHPDTDELAPLVEAVILGQADISELASEIDAYLYAEIS